MVIPNKYHKNPTVSNINVDIWIFFGAANNIPWKSGKEENYLSHMGFTLKVFPEPLTDLNAWMGLCTSSPQQGATYQHWYLDYFGGVDPMHISWDIAKGRQNSFSLGVYVKGIDRAFDWHKCLGGILHLKSTAGSLISTLIFWFFSWGTLKISHEKLTKDGKVLSHLGCMSKVLTGPLTDISACVGFCTSSPQQGL